MPRGTTPREYRRGPLRAVWPSPARPATRRAARRADGDYGVSAEPDWRGVDWPAHTRRVELPHGPVNVVELGEGEHGVLFVHGLGGSWQNWLENLPATAAAGHRAIALDLPGFGCSPLPVRSISITGFAATVDALCAALDLGPVTLVGNSMGGFTAAETAIRHPARVERLVLVDAAGISSAIARGRVSERLGRVLVTGAIGGARPASRDQALRMLRRPGLLQASLGAVARHPTLLARDLVAEQLNSIGAPGFFPALEAILGHDLTGRLGEIACPTLVVQGTEDVLVPLGDAYEYARRIARATTVVLEDTGHVPQLERPRAFNGALLDFIAAGGASPEPADAPSVVAAGPA